MNAIVRIAMAACLTLAAAMSPAIAAPANEVIVVSGSPLEVAARMRSLNQRLSKLYLQVRLSVEKENSETRIEQGIRLFDAQLASLQKSKLDAPAAIQLEQVATQWAEMRRVLQEPADDTRAQRLANTAEQLTKHAGTLVQVLEENSSSPVTKLADKASRNDMLAQRLARIYMQIKAGNKGDAQVVALEQTRKEFLATLESLDQANENTPMIISKLNLARLQWQFLERAADEKGWNEAAVRNVATTSERISEMMNDVAGSYRRLAPTVAAGSTTLARN